VVKFAYGYSYASDRNYQEDLVNSTADELYGYDTLHRGDPTVIACSAEARRPVERAVEAKVGHRLRHRSSRIPRLVVPRGLRRPTRAQL
jgi:hypothetical protein